MKINFRKKPVLILFMLLGIATLFSSSIAFFSFNNKAYAANEDNSTLIVQKIGRTATDLDEDGYTYEDTTSFPKSSDEIAYEINDQDFVMLNNSQADTALLAGSSSETVENILVTFGSEKNIYWLTVTAKLNGVSINTAGTITEDYVSGKSVKLFKQSLDLKTLTTLNLQTFDSLEGYYEYEFKYHYYYDDYQSTYGEVTKTFGFWLLDEDTYINVSQEKTETVIPKLFNTEKIDKQYYSGVEHNYFNYNNFNNVDTYDYNETSNQEVLFPTFVYDASRYNIAYTKTLYGETTTFTTNFTVENGIGFVSYYEDDSLEPFKVDSVTSTELNGKTYYFYDNLKINDIGAYTFTISYLYKEADNNFILATTEAIYETHDTDNDIALEVFGYQMYYAKDNTGEAEFKGLSDETMYITDYTFKNDNYINNYDTNNWTTSTDEIIVNSNIASTNQAPIFLKSYGALVYENYTISRSFYNYYPSGSKTGAFETIPYTNNTRFTQNGYYELTIIYDFQNYQVLSNNQIISASNTVHMQVFAFKIANLPPAVSVTTSTGSVITNGKYTNADYVTANWSTSGIFDVSPSAKLWRQEFDGFNPYTQANLFNGAYDNVNGEVYTKNTQITEDGHYTLQVFYGPSQGTSIIYKFTIDKADISGFEVVGVNVGVDENDNIVYLKEELDLTGNTVINTPFTLNWDAKASGASITTTYSFTPIGEIENSNIEKIVENDEIWITNGYETKLTFSNLTYYKTNNTTEGLLNANSVLTQASIYVFNVTDLAGNSFDYYVVLDNTQAQLLQDPEPISAYNYVPTTATVTWGTHKAIEISTNSNLTTLLNNSSLDTSLFKSANGKTYLLVPIKQVKIYSASLSESDKLIGNPNLEEQRIRTYTDINSSNSYVTFYTGLEASIPADNEDVTGENIYNLYVIDNSYIDNATNLTYDNEVFYDLKMNLDRSQGTGETYGSVKDNENNNYIELPIQRASNRQYLYFSYINSDDDYSIQELTYAFYPLTFEEGSPNYPYASTPTKSNADLLADSTLINAETNLYRTSILQIVYSTEYEKQITMPGMYVITRVYSGSAEIFTDTGDSKEKNYTYYIDRYDIIEQTDNTLIGEHIKLILGDVENKEPIVFNDFLINTTKETLLETNILPVDLLIPENKYSYYDEISDSYSGGISSFDLVVTLQHEYTLSNGATVTDQIDTLDIIDGKIVLPSLYKDGIYRVIIKDKTGYGITLTGANQFVFSFEIQNNKPTALFYGTAINDEDIAFIGVNSTNDDNLKVMWQDPEDVYTAKIDANNLSVSMIEKGESSKTLIYKIVDGEVILNAYDISLNSTYLGMVYSSDTAIERYKYELIIFNSESALSSLEATYEVNIQYEGLEEHYIYENNNFYSNQLQMTIDRTAPSYNLNRLINSDSYLSNSQKDIITQEDAEINTENYAFAVTSAFAFNLSTSDNPSQDTYEIYYRKYNKYEEGTENLQSLIPGDEYYYDYENEPTRPRFSQTNPLYTAYGYGRGSFISSLNNALNGDYYEIIEIDEAGNHTIYSIQIFFFGAEMQMGALLEAVDELEEGETLEDYYSYLFRNNSSQQILEAFEMKVYSINSKDEWYTLTIKNNATNSTFTFKHNKETVEEDFIASINSTIEVTDQIKLSGASYTISLIDRTNKGFSFVYNVQGQALSATFEDLENSFLITLPTDTASTTIEKFEVYRSINGEIEFTDAYRVYYDMNGVALDESAISGAIYEFEPGEYYFYFTDNFNRYYPNIHFFGLTDIAKIIYQGNTSTIDNVNYTANGVTVVYQTQLYNVKIYKNGETYYYSIYETIDASTGIAEINLYDIALAYNLEDEWQIQIYDSAGNSKLTQGEGNFVVYTKTPVITLTDGSDNEFAEDSFITTKSVYISYENTDILPYDATLTLTYENENGVTESLVYNEIDFETGYYILGTYTLSFTNVLGKVKSYTWKIEATETTVYSVITTLNNVETVLSPSPEKYTYNNKKIDHYFSTLVPVIYVNPDMNILGNEEPIEIIQDETLNVTTKIYHLYQELQDGNYDRYIAVSIVPTSTNFIATNLLVNDYYRGGSSFKTTSNPTTVSWNSYNLFEGNYIYADYYFNGNYAGTIGYNPDDSVNTVNLEDAGVYLFQFYDFAGNIQLFNNQNSYEIIVINEVLFSVNGTDPIDDRIYNGPVLIQIEELDQYDFRTQEISATKDGYEYLAPTDHTYYNFTEYGLYNVTLKATVTLATESESRVIYSNYSFIILNPNEAKLAFEYTPQTGYEITKVVKDDVDVTNTFKQAYTTNTLTSLFLSQDEGGNGNYTITITANYLTLKPSQSFSFDVWINNETPMILSSISEGSTTTDNIMLSFNKYLIYQQIGDSVIYINDEEVVVINSETSAVNEITNYQLTENNTYLIQLKTNAGNTVLSFKVVKKAPLNTVAVILIIVGSLIVVSLIIVFIKLRTRMKVS